MSIAEASSTLVNIGEETTYATTPTTAIAARYTGEGINFSPETVQSAEISENVDVQDLIPVGGATEGDLNFEFSFGEPFETLLEHALRGTFALTPNFNLDGGVARKSLTLEKVFVVSADADPQIISLLYNGCRVNTLSLAVTSRSLITGVVGIRGKKPIVASGVRSTAQVFTGADLVAANTNPIMTASNVGTITVGGITGTFSYTDLSWQLTNNLRDLPQIGSDDPVDINYGQRVITGTFAPYFEQNGQNIYNALLDGTPFSLSYVLNDAPTTPNSYTVELPNCKFSSGTIVAQGNNQDVLAQMEFTALEGTLASPVGASAIRITKSS